MTRVLFVSNGHGEAAIAKRIAAELHARGHFITQHFAAVGSGFGEVPFPAVGPQRTMPSGGLVAMGNLRALWSDVRAGLLVLLVRQLVFLSRAHTQYDAVVAVGDSYALLLAYCVRRPAIFVGTAKSVYVAPYGPFERRLLRAARRIFVRDAATAALLRRQGVAAESPGNVIVDLLATDVQVDWGEAVERIALLPGSRERAYDDAARLADVARRVARLVPQTVTVMSVAPMLDPERFAQALSGEPPIAAWHGQLGALLAKATLAIGQAGTANEAAAACGVPVVALEFAGARRSAWYRMRQARLLGDALAIVAGEPESAAREIVRLLNDVPRRRHMAQSGRERMGERGGAATIAGAIAGLPSTRR